MPIPGARDMRPPMPRPVMFEFELERFIAEAGTGIPVKLLFIPPRVYIYCQSSRDGKSGMRRTSRGRRTEEKPCSWAMATVCVCVCARNNGKKE